MIFKQFIFEENLSKEATGLQYISGIFMIFYLKQGE
jgi:hypothetical protein